MNKGIKFLKLLTPLLIILSSCSSIKVSSDYDTGVDFSRYKTYQLHDLSELKIDDLNKRRIVGAVTDQLKLKGFTESENADVIIDIGLNTRGESRATATSTPSMTYYRPRWGYGTSFSTTTVQYEEYLVGTIFVSMIDAGSDQLVWQGRGEGTIDPNAKSEKREERIKMGMVKIFAQYPPKK